MRVLGYDWQPQSLGRLAGYRAALSAIRTENAEWVSRFRAIPIGTGEIMGTHSKKVSVRTVVLSTRETEKKIFTWFWSHENWFSLVNLWKDKASHR